MSRPLLYLHLQKLEEANLISSDMVLLESGKAAKYYMLNSFELQLNDELISKLEPTLTLKKIKRWWIKSMSKLNEKLRLISIIFLYLFSGFILYVLTDEHKTFFLLYKFIYGILISVILYYAYKYLAKKYK